MEHIQGKLKGLSFPLTIIISGTVLSISSLYSFLLFHTVAELFTIVIAIGIFVVAWASRNYSSNKFLLVFGIGYLFIGILDLVHLLSYPGLDVIKGSGSVWNLSVQIWIVARFLEAISFSIALLFLKEENKKNEKSDGIIAYIIFLTYSIIFIFLLLFIFHWKIFPVAYVDKMGFTTFSNISEYVICVLFLIALIFLFKKKEKLDEEMAGLLTISLIAKIASEMFFTEEMGVYYFSNMFGHFLKFISFLLLYKAVLELGIVRPYAFLFSDLKKSEERYRSLVDFSPDPIVVHADETVVYANKPARKLFGAKKKDDLIGAKFSGFFHPKYQDLIKLRIKKIIEGKRGQVPLFEFQVLRPDNSTVIVEMKGERISYEGKVAVESIIRDISERRRVEKELARAQLELRKKTEEQLAESYTYLGLVNRKISILLELESHAKAKKNKQEIVDYILNSAVSLSKARVGFLYATRGGDYFNLLSSIGIEKEKFAYFKRISKSNIGFINDLIRKKKRVNGVCDLAGYGYFKSNAGVEYFVALPLIIKDNCRGFIFLGFDSSENIDPNGLKFLDVFSKHVSSVLSDAEILGK